MIAPRVSVVIPTYRRPELLERCLAALRRQTLPADAFEIVVVHDGPSPSFVAQTNALACKHTAKGGPALHAFATRARGGPAAARNLGWRQAQGEIVAFTDDDTIPDADWLAAAYARFAAAPADAPVDAATGRVVMPLATPPTDYERDAAGLASAEFVTANCFVSHAMLERLGGFDERFERAWREDSDLHFRLLGSGARIVSVPDAVVVHPVRPAPWGESLRQQRKVLFDALLYKKHPRLYRQRIRRAPRWDYYAAVVALGAAAAGAAFGAAAIAAPAAVAWGALTARFSAARLAGTRKSAAHVAEMIVTSAAIPPLAVFWRAVGALRFRVPFV